VHDAVPTAGPELDPASARLTYGPTMAPDLLAAVRSESDRFAGALAAADPTAPVPCCPDWTAADLTWHLTEVQLLWATVVRERLDVIELAGAVVTAQRDGIATAVSRRRPSRSPLASQGRRGSLGDLTHRFLRVSFVV
jgi:hypothetical protein